MGRPSKLNITVPIIEHIGKTFIWQYGWPEGNTANEKPIPPKKHGSPVKIPKNKKSSTHKSSSP
jgi:hypothetical protein